MLSMLGKHLSRQHFKIFFLFSQKIGFDISCKLSPAGMLTIDEDTSAMLIKWMKQAVMLTVDDGTTGMFVKRMKQTAMLTVDEDTSGMLIKRMKQISMLTVDEVNETKFLCWQLVCWHLRHCWHADSWWRHHWYADKMNNTNGFADSRWSEWNKWVCWQSRSPVVTHQQYFSYLLNNHD